MKMEFIDPGTLRHEVMLQKAELIADGAGGHQENWVEVATMFARVEPVSAQSSFGAAQPLETATHRVTLRYREGLQGGMRFIWRGRILAIITVHDPDETQRYLICRAREGRI